MLEKMSKKQMALTSVALSFMMVVAFTGSNLYAENYADRIAYESSIASMLILALVGVIIAGALLPIIANQTAVIEADTTNFSSNEISLIGLWPLLIVVGVMMAIIGFAL